MMADGGTAGDFSRAQAIYDSIFPRIQSREPQIRRLEEFPGLEREERYFCSNQGQKLAGYIYKKKALQPRGVVIIAHGLGVGGQCVYMDAADYFTSHGYLVFAYDATGNDRSEGDSGIGMEQGIIDLSHAIDYVEKDGCLGKYPIVLYGHSWGAYCVGAVLLDHPEVKAVVAIAGFNSSTEWLRYAVEADDPSGNLAVLKQYVPLIEQMKFGKYADYTALDGFSHTQAGIMIIQSSDDRNVPPAVGYDLYAEKYGQDPRFQFQLFKDRGHLYLFYTDAARDYDLQRVDELNATLTAYGKTHAFDKAVGYAMDSVLFAGIREFFDKHCEKALSETRNRF